MLGIFGGGGSPGRGVRSRSVSASSSINVFGDGHAGGQAGGADTTDEDVVLGGVDVDEVVAVVDRRAQARVGRGDLFVEQGRHQSAALAEQEFESGFGGAGGGAVLEVF